MFDYKKFSELIKKSNHTSATLSKELKNQGIKISKDTIDAYRKGAILNPPIDKLSLIANIIRVKTSLFLDDENETKIRTIPLIGLASCGIPQEYDLNGYEPVPVSEDIYEDGMYAVKAEGDSMSTKINNGDIVYCNMNRQIDNGNIVHYSLNGESGIKRYKINERGDIISLVPINSEYDIITVHADDNANLKMARVVGSVDMDY